MRVFAFVILLIVLISGAFWLIGGDSDAGVANMAKPPIGKTKQNGIGIGNGKVSRPVEARQPLLESDGVRSIDVVALRFDTNTPIKGADVGYLVYSRDQSGLTHGDLEGMRRDTIEFYRRWGQVQTTDANGICRIPKIPGTTVAVVLRFEALFAKVYLHPQQTEPVTAILRPDHDVVITVLAGDGRPAAGVDVVMRESGKSVKRRMLGRTDTNGKVIHYHSQAYLGEGSSNLASFVAEGIGMESAPVEVDILSRRTVEIVLRMPPSGTITLQLETESGAPYGFGGRSAPTVAYSMHKHRSALVTGSPAVHMGKLDSNGRMVLRNVALGMFYSLKVHVYRPDALVGVGPTLETPDVVVPLVVRNSMVTLSGRAVDPIGAPIANTKLGIDIRLTNGRSFARYHTDSDGVFVLAGGFLKPGQTIKVTGSILGRDRHDLPEPERTSGKADNLKGLITTGLVVKAGVNDVGDVTFGNAGLILSGRLVVPVALEATQRVHWVVEQESNTGNGNRSSDRWTIVSGYTTSWHEGRCFEIRGFVVKGRKLRLHFQEGPYLAMEPMEFTPGTKDIDVRLVEAGTVTATMLANTGEGSQPKFIAKLETENPSERQKRSQERTRRGRPQAITDRDRLRVTGKGSLEAIWRGLEPGLYSLTINSTESGERLVTIDGIKVTQGEVDDGRLKGIDLLGKMRAIEISVIDHQGDPVMDRNARVLIANADGEGWETRRLTNGKLRLSVAVRVSIRVLAKGYRLASLDNVRADEVIRMERAPELRLRVKWPLGLPQSALPEIRLTPRNSYYPKTGVRRGRPTQATRLLWESHVDCSVGADGSAVVRPTVLGVHSISIVMSPGGTRYYSFTSPRTIEVTGKESGEIVLEVIEKRLRQAIKQMKRR